MTVIKVLMYIHSTVQYTAHVLYNSNQVKDLSKFLKLHKPKTHFKSITAKTNKYSMLICIQ